MKTRNILTMSLLLVSFLLSKPMQARAAQEMNRPRPDLATRFVSIDEYKVVAVVANFGKAPSGVCVLRLSVIDPNDSVTVLKTFEVAVPAVTPGTTYYATFNTAPQKARGNRLHLWVDPSGRVEESNENNNSRIDISTVTKSSPNTGGGFPKGDPADLIIKAIAGTPSDKRALRVQVANVGGYETSPPCTLTIDIFATNSFNKKDLAESKDFDVPALKKGETKWLLIQVDKEFEQSDNKNQVTPLMPFQLTVDSKNAVEESQKANNKNSYPVPTNYKP